MNPTPNSLTAKLISEATNRKTVSHAEAVPVDLVIVVVQKTVPRIVCFALRRTPPTTQVSNKVENTIVVAVTTRKTEPSIIICSIISTPT